MGWHQFIFCAKKTLISNDFIGFYTSATEQLAGKKQGGFGYLKNTEKRPDCWTKELATPELKCLEQITYCQERPM
jgi:hypothetical protein